MENQNLKKARAKLEGPILDFLRVIQDAPCQTFSIPALTWHCLQLTGCAPDSPSRILRKLREDLVLDYEVTAGSQAVLKAIRSPEEIDQLLQDNSLQLSFI
jgi:hypothetical protein